MAKYLTTTSCTVFFCDARARRAGDDVAQPISILFDDPIAPAGAPPAQLRMNASQALEIAAALKAYAEELQAEAV